LAKEVVRELRIVTTAVAKAEGEIVQLSPTRYMSPELAAALDGFKKLATGTLLRPEGLTLHSTQNPPSEETIRELMDTIALDREWESKYNRNFFRAAHEAQPVWGDAKRLYHSSMMLDYVVMRHVGWVDPMDREWLLTEKGSNPMEVYGCDYGFSLSRDLKASLGYGRPGFGASFAEQLYQACGRELPDALKALRDQSVVLAMDARGLKSAFPTGKILWVGTNSEFEICCPLLPANIPEVGLEPLAIVRWKPGHSI
jgi:hypothetical protein